MSAASMQLVALGHVTRTELVVSAHSVVAVTPSSLVVALIEHETLPVLTTVRTHGCACTAGFKPQVEWA